MKRSLVFVGLAQALVLGGLIAGVAGHWFPLGVRGEWEWLRLGATSAPVGGSLAFGGLAILGFVGFVARGARALGGDPGRSRQAAWVALLAVAGVVAQAVVQEGAPAGLGLAKWIIALQNSGSSGYHSVARHAMPGGLRPFLAAYPAWIERQDSLHIGTHPPGLFVVARGLDDLTRRHPSLTRHVVAFAPGSAGAAIRLYQGNRTLTRDEAAALALTGALTLLGSALSVIPLYLLARAGGSARVAWAAAALWPLLPAAVMFQPTADTALPLLSLSALAAAAWSARSRETSLRFALATLAGVILAVGMQFTLVFLAVGLIVAIQQSAGQGPSDWRSRLVSIAGTGLGFLGTTAVWWAATAADPIAIWWSNQAHHARFYHDYPRSRLAWTGVNLVESAVAIGVASTVWGVIGLARPRSLPTATWATVLVLAALTVSGRSLSEVARLWLPMYPAVLLGPAVTWERWGASPASLGWTVALVGLQTLTLQTLIQVVYPV